MSVERNQNILVANEEPVIHCKGNIHIGEDNYGSEFVATDRRLFYNQGGMTKDIDYRHVSSVEVGSEVKKETHGTSLAGAFVLGIIGIIAGLFILISSNSLIVTAFGGIVILMGAAILLSTHQDPDQYGVESTEKVIHHVRLIRDNEAPLYITTGSDIGSRLRNLVANSKHKSHR